MAAIAASLDGATLALQRSAAQVQFQQREGPPLVFVQAPQSRAPLLGFFWTRCGDGDFVMVTRSGALIIPSPPMCLVCAPGSGCWISGSRQAIQCSSLAVLSTRLAFAGTVCMWAFRAQLAMTIGHSLPTRCNSSMSAACMLMMH